MLVFSRVTLRTESVEITSPISLLAVGLFKLSVLFGHTWYGGSRLCGIAPYYIGCQADTGVDVLFLTILCSWEKSLQHPGDRVWFGHLCHAILLSRLLGFVNLYSSFPSI